MSRPAGTVVVADDDPNLADSVAAALPDRHDVRVAYGGREALQRVDDAVDVVLLDRRMPDLSGDEVLDELRSRDVDCRVAMVTAVEPDFDIVEMAFDDYVVKPASTEEIRRIVDRLLRRDRYDAKVQQLFALAAKRAALAARKGEGELADSPEFETLRARFERLDAELTETVRTLEAREAFETATGRAD